MNFKKRKWIFIALLLVIVVVWSMGQYDYTTLVAGKRPIFARSKMFLADGGSIEYRGFGYKVTKMHRLAGGMASDKPGMMTFHVGATLDYWIPFCGSESTRSVTETNR
jgi:hypothetical protein